MFSSCAVRRLLISLPFLIAPTFATFQNFGIPPSDATVDVKAFNVANFTLNNLTNAFLNPVLPGRENLTLPMHAFLIEHKPTQKLFMFDLGMRNDPQNLPPAFAGFFSSGTVTFDAFSDITELLQGGGVSLDSIDAVFWSHAHFDHIGDMSKFPNSTQIIVGGTTDLSIFPANSKSDLQASDLAGHNVAQLDFSNANLTFGGMEAIDQFGDGSFYLLNSPGHLTGHMSALARVTPSSFIVLGGDTLHHVGQLRPSGAFQTNIPCPGDLLADARSAISTDFFWSANTTPGAFDLPSRTRPFFAVSDATDSFYVDPVAATISVDKLAAFDADADFFTIIAHDRSILETLPYFPASLSTWQADGLKANTAWLFVDPTNPAFLFSPA
ncbi:beta-lactamase-like protein [Mycena galopus ATCC 62051]|nr:beta-lactamase-like protein [Mycena galopus ATCC 62051]